MSFLHHQRGIAAHVILFGRSFAGPACEVAKRGGSLGELGVGILKYIGLEASPTPSEIDQATTGHVLEYVDNEMNNEQDFEMKPLVTFVALVTAATRAFSGSIAEPVHDTSEVVAELFAPTPSFGGEWTDFSGGVQIGRLDVDGTGAADGHDLGYGVHAGYGHDFGSFVLDCELDHDVTGVDLGGTATVGNVTRLKLSAGYDIGRTLLYATAGVARLDTSIGSEICEFGGVGMVY